MSANRSRLLKPLVNVLASTTGRDKICRTLQYGVKFIVAVIRHQIQAGLIPKEKFELIAARLDRLGGNMSMTRKVLRIGRPIGLTITLLEQFKQLCDSDVNGSDIKKHPLYVSAKIGSTFSLIWFFLLDHVSYLAKVDLMDKRPVLVSKSEYYSTFFWLLDSVFGVVANTTEIIHFLRKEKWNSGQDGKTNLEETMVDLVRCVVDIPAAFGFMHPERISGGTVGFLGTLSSLIGCYQIWK